MNMQYPQGDTVSFAIKARPVSLQGSPAAKRELKRLVTRAIFKSQFLLSGEVEFLITLQVHERERYEGIFSPDVDNIIKPLLDALCGSKGILVNDCQVQSVRCSWIDWTRTDHNLLFEIRHEPDAWIPKKNLVWVEVADKLCMPLNTDAKPAVQEAMLAVWQRMFSTRKELLKRGADYYEALTVMPIQRPFFKARLKGFKVISLQTAARRIARLKSRKRKGSIPSRKTPIQMVSGSPLRKACPNTAAATAGPMSGKKISSAGNPRFSDVIPGGPCATPAHGSRHITLECHYSNPRGHDVQRFLGAGAAAEKLIANAIRQATGR
jgi:hypothetical protein